MIPATTLNLCILRLMSNHHSHYYYLMLQKAYEFVNRRADIRKPANYAYPRSFSLPVRKMNTTTLHCYSEHTFLHCCQCGCGNPEYLNYPVKSFASETHTTHLP